MPRNIIISGGTGRVSIKGDKDAKDYIRRVEIADGQFLESNTRNAIIDFVIGCKNDGTWNAITSCCILAGARTLAGALIPLKGVAPTNFNFVNSDYNRATGLKGNGSSKALNSGLTSNSFPGSRRESQHLSVNISEFTGGAINMETFIGYDMGSAIGTNITYVGGNNRIEYSCISTTNPSSIINVAEDRRVSGFTGVTRSNINSYNLFFAPPYFSQSINNTALPPVPDKPVFVFARGRSPGAPNQYTTARINFYSIGTNIDSLLLNNRVTTLLNAYSNLT